MPKQFRVFNPANTLFSLSRTDEGGQTDTVFDAVSNTDGFWIDHAHAKCVLPADNFVNECGTQIILDDGSIERVIFSNYAGKDRASQSKEISEPYFVPPGCAVKIFADNNGAVLENMVEIEGRAL